MASVPAADGLAPPLPGQGLHALLPSVRPAPAAAYGALRACDRLPVAGFGRKGLCSAQRDALAHPDIDPDVVARRWQGRGLMFVHQVDCAPQCLAGDSDAAGLALWQPPLWPHADGRQAVDADDGSAFARPDVASADIVQLDGAVAVGDCGTAGTLGFSFFLRRRKKA